MKSSDQPNYNIFKMLQNRSSNVPLTHPNLSYNYNINRVKKRKFNDEFEKELQNIESHSNTVPSLENHVNRTGHLDEVMQELPLAIEFQHSRFGDQLLRGVMNRYPDVNLYIQNLNNKHIHKQLTKDFEKLASEEKKEARGSKEKSRLNRMLKDMKSVNRDYPSEKIIKDIMQDINNNNNTNNNGNNMNGSGFRRRKKHKVKAKRKINRKRRKRSYSRIPTIISQDLALYEQPDIPPMAPPLDLNTYNNSRHVLKPRDELLRDEYEEGLRLYNAAHPVAGERYKKRSLSKTKHRKR